MTNLPPWCILVFNSPICHLKKLALEDALQALVVPGVDATLEVGRLIENLPQLWKGANLEERRKILLTMLDGVYVDAKEEKRIVGIWPKPPFYPLFESLKQKPDNKVMVFNPNDSALQKTTGSGLDQEPDFGLVETGES